MARRRVDLREAAEILDTTVDAVRKRVKRGTLERDKGEDGRVYVWLDLDQTVNPEDASASALVKAKDETIELLRHQLEQEREANRENRRLLAAALERIPELPAGQGQQEQETSAAPEATGGHQTGAEEPGRGTAPDEAYGPPEEPRKRSWWREFLGME